MANGKLFPVVALVVTATTEPAWMAAPSVRPACLSGRLIAKLAYRPLSAPRRGRRAPAWRRRRRLGLRPAAAAWRMQTGRLVRARR